MDGDVLLLGRSGIPDEGRLPVLDPDAASGIPGGGELLAVEVGSTGQRGAPANDRIAVRPAQGSVEATRLGKRVVGLLL